MKRKGPSFLLFLVALAAVVRLARVGAQSLWVDEILTLSVSIPDPGLTIWDYLKYNIHGPLHAFVVYIFHFVSTNDAWLRLPSVIAGVLAVFFFYRWVGVWLGERTARVSSVLLAVHPLHVYYSQEARNYSFLFLFAVAASYVFHQILRRETLKGFALYVVAMACAALSNFTAAFLFFIHSVIYLCRAGNLGRRVIRWGLVSLAVLVLISPWVYRIHTFIDVTKLVTPVMPGEITTEERLRGETTVGSETLPYLLYVFSVGFSLGPSTRELHYDASLSSVIGKHGPTVLWVALLFGTLTTAGAVSWVRKRGPRGQIALYLVVPVVLTLLLCWQNAKAFTVRYVLLAFPAYVCLVGSGILVWRSAGRVVAAVAVGATLLVSLGNYYFDGRFGRDDVRSAARWIEERAEVTDCILTHTVTEVFQHYYSGPNPVHSVFAPLGTPRDRVDRQLEELLANCDTVWYLRAREWVDDPEGYLLDVLDSRFVMVESHNFEGVKVFLYRRRGGY